MIKLKFEYLLILLFLFGILAHSVKSDTITLSADPKMDYSFTTKNSLIFSNNQFIFNNIRLTPEFSINKVVRNLSAVTFNTQIKDEKYRYKFGFNISRPITTARLDYIMFKIPSECSKNTETSLKCGKNEIDFIDVVESGYTISITNDIINITGSQLSNSIISLDPTIQMLPNATNKAWENTSSQPANCANDYWLTNTEFTSTKYNQINISDNSRYTLGATSLTITPDRCTMAKFSFNVSSVVVDLGTITGMVFYHEGYHTNEYDSFADLWYYNATSGYWVYIDYVDYGSDTIHTKTFASTDILASGIATFGLKVHCVFKAAINTITDMVYLNVTTSGGATPITPEGDPLYCSIPPLVPLNSTVIMCMPRDNTTGQPITSATINCGAYSSPLWASTVQASSAMGESGYGLYNWTLQVGNMAASTCYLINCTTTINTINNRFGGSLCVLPSFATACASTAEVNAIGVNISGLNTTLIGLGINTSDINAVLIALGINASTINETCNLGFANATENFTNIENLINTLNDVSAQDVWEYVTRDVNCSNCSGEGSNTTYNTTTNNYLDINRTQLKNISKVVWELAPEDVNNLYILIILISVVITFITLMLVSYKRRWFS